MNKLWLCVLLCFCFEPQLQGVSAAGTMHLMHSRVLQGNVSSTASQSRLLDSFQRNPKLAVVLDIAMKQPAVGSVMNEMLADGGLVDRLTQNQAFKDFTARTLGRLSQGEMGNYVRRLHKIVEPTVMQVWQNIPVAEQNIASLTLAPSVASNQTSLQGQSFLQVGVGGQTTRSVTGTIAMGSGTNARSHGIYLNLDTTEYFDAQSCTAHLQNSGSWNGEDIDALISAGIKTCRTCNSNQVEAVACSSTGNADCACKAGYTGQTNSDCTACEAGKYGPGGSEACKDCGLFEYSSSGAPSCESGMIGMGYTSMILCIICWIGFISLTVIGYNKVRDEEGSFLSKICKTYRPNCTNPKLIVGIAIVTLISLITGSVFMIMSATIKTDENNAIAGFVSNLFSAALIIFLAAPSVTEIWNNRRTADLDSNASAGPSHVQPNVRPSTNNAGDEASDSDGSDGDRNSSNHRSDNGLGSYQLRNRNGKSSIVTSDKTGSTGDGQAMRMGQVGTLRLNPISLAGGRRGGVGKMGSGRSF